MDCVKCYIFYISIKLRNIYLNKDFIMVINDIRVLDGFRWCGLMIVVKFFFECFWFYGNI